MDLREMGAVDATNHWYYQSKIIPFLSSLTRFMPNARTILDVGAGSGFFGISLSNSESITRVTCIDPNYLEERIQGKIEFVKHTTKTSADVYIFADVLEHVENDVELLKSYTDSAEPGSLVLISVPALTSLWSQHDEFLGHFRRYKLDEISRVAEKSGLLVIERYYLFGIIFPLVWLLRRVRKNSDGQSDMKNASSWANWCLKVSLRFEHRLRINRLMGVSAYVAAIKQ
jgi:2-polyprenyl-3-methyl-5-hydroxy-6-metoxy-1,4-benzoquinol methylase